MLMRFLSVVVISVASCGCAFAQEPARASSSDAHAELPVREVTVFKDGHAFVLRESTLDVGAGGEVVLDDLPQPVLGTFWPYASGAAHLVSATAAKTRVKSEHTALDVRQLLEANVGAEVVLLDVDGKTTSGTLLPLPVRSAEELERAEPGSGPRLPTAGAVALVRQAEGTKAIALDRIRDVTFRGDPKGTYAVDELRDRLTLRVAFAEGSAGRRAQIGVAYVQKGLRWIPAYKLDVAGGHAKVELEGTLVNDLTDLSNATVNLVIGVPRFEFAGQVDPIALQQIAAQVASQLDAGGGRNMSNMLSNALMTQAAEYAPGPAQTAPAPEVEGAASNEDLFVFTVRNVSLRRGERMVLPIASFELGYRDVYVLDVAVAPPPEMRENFQGERAAELARMLAAPKAMHALRIRNDSKAPLTTAPALVLANGKVLAQGLMTYTPIGAESDLPLTTAVDVSVVKTEKELKRTPDAVEWDHNKYQRVDMTGAIELSNRKPEALEIEVRRGAFGFADGADSNGTFEQISLAEAWSSAWRAPWWSWSNWPYWWYQFNGFATFRWKLTLAPGAKATLTANWHYFSRP